jgi:hypothetical protein
VLSQLSYARTGRRDSNPQPLEPRRNPHLRSRPTSNCQGADNRRGIEWLRGQASNPDLLLQRQAWYQFHHLALSASGRRDSNSQPPAPEAGALPLRHVQGLACRTDGGSRTRTDGGLSAVPLPVGLRQQVVHRGPRGIRTRNLLLAGESRSRCASGPGWTRGRESNPRAGRMRPRCTQCPRSVTGRTRTGFLRGHDPASRPLRTSVTVDEEGLEPPASSL